VKKLKDRPFALIGVNVNGYDPAQLKAAMEKEELGWRSFADPGPLGRGPITVSWNLTATPTFYLLDHRGVIRRKWVGGSGGAVLDSAIERLLREAEGRGSPR